jgi:hypothetical protein
MSHLGLQTVSAELDEAGAPPEAAAGADEDWLHPETSNPMSVTAIGAMFLL